MKPSVQEIRWYKQTWPWLLMLPPLVSVVGGVAVLCLAIGTNDGLVATDYYRQGVTINERLTQERAASECPAKDLACSERRVREGP
jgi:hypothetical protein